MLTCPGIGQYTIVDPCEVTEEDTGVNFFVEGECVGQSRAKVCCEMLQELNPDVRGRYFAEVRVPPALLLIDGSLLRTLSVRAYAWVEHRIPPT
jgi:amyloid beta precursor protein binding protein 1